ncbi:hypothetical protein HMPREF9137_2309 [Prevotella denticola F0289]|nr:hypothetical protein HMPREF9137_2309 [Prevotella denticola F0289]
MKILCKDNVNQWISKINGYFFTADGYFLFHALMERKLIRTFTNGKNQNITNRIWKSMTL